MTTPPALARGGPAGPRPSSLLPQQPRAGGLVKPHHSRTVSAASFLEGLFGRKPDAAPAPPPPTSSASTPSTPPPRFPPPTPAPDGSLPPPPAGTFPLGLPGVAVVSADPLVLAEDGGAAPTHTLSLVLGPAALDPASMAALTAAAGWPPRPADRLAAALAGSYLCAGALLTPLDNGRGSGGGGPPPILVASARATSDAAFNATLWDVVVHPALRGRGLGAALVERVTASLLEAGLGNVTLFSSPGALPFYGGLGYEADPEGIRGMFYVGGE